RDVATAEEVVQDSFIAMHAAWRRLRDTEKALSYLRQSVVNRSRSVLRHRVVVDKNAPKPAPDMPSAEQGAISLLERSAVIAWLRYLAPGQAAARVRRPGHGLVLPGSRGGRCRSARGGGSLRPGVNPHGRRPGCRHRDQ